jgi:hypothetical protein
MNWDYGSYVTGTADIWCLRPTKIMANPALLGYCNAFGLSEATYNIPQSNLNMSHSEITIGMNGIGVLLPCLNFDGYFGKQVSVDENGDDVYYGNFDFGLGVNLQKVLAHKSQPSRWDICAGTRLVVDRYGIDVGDYSESKAASWMDFGGLVRYSPIMAQEAPRYNNFSVDLTAGLLSSNPGRAKVEEVKENAFKYGLGARVLYKFDLPFNLPSPCRQKAYLKVLYDHQNRDVSQEGITEKPVYQCVTLEAGGLNLLFVRYRIFDTKFTASGTTYTAHYSDSDFEFGLDSQVRKDLRLWGLFGTEGNGDNFDKTHYVEVGMSYASDFLKAY